MITFNKIRFGNSLKERERQKKLPIWEKSTYSSKVSGGFGTTRKKALEMELEEEEQVEDKNWALQVTRGDEN